MVHNSRHSKYCFKKEMNSFKTIRKLVVVGKIRSTLEFVCHDFKKKVENKTTRIETLTQRVNTVKKCG